VTDLERAVDQLRARRTGRKPKYPPRKRSGRIKNVTVTPAGDHILEAARVLFKMTMSETIDAALKAWARLNKIDEAMAQRTKEAMWPTSQNGN
jgi:hypothetical protein